ncbi:MAG TPA: ABC transporter ATP-binding protein [Candidatus Limnocylindrales bacterium]|nr:ABC transporter ATP-binding protein [Candidatus Limnocylindrales bacterium]
MTPAIRFRGVAKTYAGPPSVNALRRSDLDIMPGEYVTVVGPSGSGKSTLLNIAGMLDHPSEGTYELDGIDVGPLGERSRTAIRGQRIGFVFQSFHLMPFRTALDNVARSQLYRGARRRQRIAAARQALGDVGVGHRADAIANTLSGGEKQRVAIARAVVHHPSLLLCDEPTGNLDGETGAGILELLDELHGAGMTLVMITHDPGVAGRGKRTITLRDGQLYD